ncbi:MAG: putative rRNA maturation factor [Solirubrobacteraceae bacterium]|nr:putative rRNA maturation factor [Solirubrobacteraceae bacterium]
MIEVVNRQRKIKVDCERWQLFATRASAALPVPATGATVAFVSDRTMRDLNRMWRGRRETTDVLSFPAEQADFETTEGLSLGDIVISLEQAKRQAKEHRLRFETELAQLILHGLLHLSGYDHETDQGAMNRLELKLRKRLGIEG